jgi:hypothetical protein
MRCRGRVLATIRLCASMTAEASRLVIGHRGTDEKISPVENESIDLARFNSWIQIPIPRQSHKRHTRRIYTHATAEESPIR